MTKENKRQPAPPPAPERPKLILPANAVKERAEAMASAEKPALVPQVEARRVNGEEATEQADQQEATERAAIGDEPLRASCGNCRFFVRMNQSRAPSGQHQVWNGQCRAHPPHPVLIGMQQRPITNEQVPVVNGFFPLTNEEIWCGGWLPFDMPPPGEMH